MFKEYIAYIRDNPEGKWFKPKLYGWGWTPVRWQGWVTLLVFIGLLVLNAFSLDTYNQPTDAELTRFFGVTALLVIILLYICYRKGGPTKWMWGVPDKYKNNN